MERVQEIFRYKPLISNHTGFMIGYKIFQNYTQKSALLAKNETNIISKHFVYASNIFTEDNITPFFNILYQNNLKPFNFMEYWVAIKEQMMDEIKNDLRIKLVYGEKLLNSKPSLLDNFEKAVNGNEMITTFSNTVGIILRDLYSANNIVNKWNELIENGENKNVFIWIGKGHIKGLQIFVKKELERQNLEFGGNYVSIIQEIDTFVNTTYDQVMNHYHEVVKNFQNSNFD